MKALQTKSLSQSIDSYLEEGFSQFHSPAHCGYLNPRDLSEVEGLDDLQNSQGVLKEAQESCAELFGAKQSFFLVNGASIGMQVSCLALKLHLEEKKDPRPVLVARNIHKSTMAGIILAGLKIQWLEANWNEELGIYTRVEVTKNIEKEFSALIITNPSYEGFFSQIPKLKIPLIVDEAHGAHYNFSDRLPPTALQYGADLSVQSWHKTLGSLTQTGVLHISKDSKIRIKFIEDSLKLIQTTSPSYILLESLTKVCEKYTNKGEEIISKTLAKANSLDSFRITNDDPLRYIIKVAGIKGQELDDYLVEKKISCEEVLNSSVLAFINPGNTEEDIEKLKNALSSLEKKETTKTLYPKPQIQEKSFDPRKAFFEDQDTDLVAPCPPGIIKRAPGEKGGK